MHSVLDAVHDMLHIRKHARMRAEASERATFLVLDFARAFYGKYRSAKLKGSIPYPNWDVYILHAPEWRKPAEAYH